jgi:hypothetical protein
MTDEQLAECIAQAERRLHAAGLLRRTPRTAGQVLALDEAELRRLTEEFDPQPADLRAGDCP